MKEKTYSVIENDLYVQDTESVEKNFSELTKMFLIRGKLKFGIKYFFVSYLH